MIEIIKKNIGADKIAIIFSQIASALVMLLLGKIIALNFTPQVFGEYNLQFAIYTLCFSIFLSPFLQFIKTNNNTLNLKIGYLGYIPIFIVLSILSIILLIILFHINNIDFSISVLILIFIYLLFNSLFKICIDRINTSGQLKTYSYLNLFQKLLLLLTLTIVIYSFKEKTNSLLWLYSAITSFSALFLCFFYLDFTLRSNFKVSTKKIVIKILKFSMPLVIMSIWGWINNYFDRFAINFYLSENEVGLYNASYSIGAKFFSIISLMALAILTPIVYGNQKIVTKKEKIKKYSKLYTYLAFLVIPLVFVFYPLIGKVLLSNMYAEGFYIIPGINIAFFLITLSYLFELLFYAESKTKYILYSNLAGALLNIILNIFLIPILGIYGAMLATVFSFAIKLILTIYYFIKL